MLLKRRRRMMVQSRDREVEVGERKKKIHSEDMEEEAKTEEDDAHVSLLSPLSLSLMHTRPGAQVLMYTGHLIISALPIQAVH